MDDDVMLCHYRRFLSGDEDAFTEIVREYSDQLLYFVLRIVGNFRDAEEVTADAFVQIAVKKRAFRGDSSLKTYLFSVGRNLAVDVVRRNSRRNEVSSEEELYSGEVEILEGRVLKDERDRMLHRGISELCEDYRCVLYLVYFQDMSIDDAARIMKKSKKQTENLIYRARRALKAILEKDGYDYENI